MTDDANLDPEVEGVSWKDFFYLFYSNSLRKLNSENRVPVRALIINRCILLCETSLVALLHWGFKVWV
jgi:hypothetical protein